MTELAYTLEATDLDRLEQAEALVRAFCGWHIAPSREETVVIRATGGRILMLPSMYVTEVASVTNDATLLAFDDDYIWSTAGVVATGGCWGYELVTVEMTHGYDEPPAEVTAIVQAIAQRAVSNPGGVPTSKGIGPFSESYGSLATGTALSLFESEKEVLRRYRIPVVA